MKKLESLRKKYPKFIYNSYSYEVRKGNLNISFSFFIEPDIKFKPELVIKNIDKKRIDSIKEEVLNNLVFHLGLIESLSYWKTTCSPVIEIRAGNLNKDQIKWWKDLIIKGMGQFFYENKIDWRKTNFLKIKMKENSSDKRGIYLKKLKDRFLIPVGGGKDSVVTLETLKNIRKDINCFSLNPSQASEKIIKIADCKNPVIVERKIDKELLKLNKKGFLNGHTPFSAYLAFLSVLSAILFDYMYIAFSNEMSASEGNLEYLGEIINHQYSKSFRFEKRFKEYSKKYLAKTVEYFSFLRPLNEIQIARFFSRHPKYFFAFLSCNEALKTDSGKKKSTGKWCNKCAKCLFVYSCLYPFLDKKKLNKIFGENLFEKRKLIPLMEELTGEKKFKPFECVGTQEESLIAFYLGLEKAKTEEEIPVVLKYFEQKILPKHENLEKEAKKY